MTPRLRALADHAGAAASLVVLVIAAKAILGRVGTFDIGFDDEGWILDLGLGFPARPLPPPEYGPLYALWYRVLSAFQPDPVPLYTVSWVVLQLGVAVLLHTLARRSGAPRLAAGLVTIVWTISHAVTIWPFAVYFSTAILALGAIATTFTKDRLTALTVLAVATAVATFVRPELALPGMPLAAAAIGWSVARGVRARRLRAVGPAVAVAATIAALLVAFGSPLGKGRSWFAFQQHHALHRVQTGGLDVDPWTAYPPIIAADFPTAQSIGGAALENPAAFAWHVGRNARLLPARLAWFGEIAAYVPPPVKYAVAPAAGLVLLVGAFALLRRRRPLSPRLLGWLPIWVPVGASFAAAMLIIYPRDHYIVPFAFFAGATFAAASGGLSSRTGRVAPFLGPAGLVAAITLLALLPSYGRGVLPSLLAARGTPPPTEWEHRNTVAALRALELQGERVILETEYSRAAYARIPFRSVHLAQKDCPFFELLAKHTIDIVIVNQRLREDPRFREDPQFQSFVAEGGDRQGFVFTPVPGTAIVIAHRP